MTEKRPHEKRKRRKNRGWLDIIFASSAFFPAINSIFACAVVMGVDVVKLALKDSAERCRAFLLCALVSGISSVKADPPGTIPPAISTPTTVPASTQPIARLSADSSIRKYFLQLADVDPKVREQAKFELMGMNAIDLPRLRQLVIDSQPVAPSQSAALHDIVLQSFLASDKYTIQNNAETDANGDQGPFFLGILWPGVDLEEARLGVSVDERLPGFPSYRFLRTGDMILGIYLDPDAPLLQLPNMETHSRTALVQAIAGSPATQNIVLSVLRDGQTIKVAVKMAPRPTNMDGIGITAIRAFNQARVERADQYWQENFAPLLEAGNATSNLAGGP